MTGHRCQHLLLAVLLLLRCVVSQGLAAATTSEARTTASSSSLPFLRGLQQHKPYSQSTPSDSFSRQQYDGLSVSNSSSSEAPAASPESSSTSSAASSPGLLLLSSIVFVCCIPPSFFARCCCCCCRRADNDVTGSSGSGGSSGAGNSSPPQEQLALSEAMDAFVGILLQRAGLSHILLDLQRSLGARSMRFFSQPQRQSTSSSGGGSGGGGSSTAVSAAGSSASYSSQPGTARGSRDGSGPPLPPACDASSLPPAMSSLLLEVLAYAAADATQKRLEQLLLSGRAPDVLQKLREQVGMPALEGDRLEEADSGCSEQMMERSGCSQRGL